MAVLTNQGDPCAFIDARLVVLFHASLDIAINTPAASSALQTGMGALITLAGLVGLVRYGPRDLAPVTRQMARDDATVCRATEVA